MNTQDLLDPTCWAERTFGTIQLHDQRRTRRTVKAASHLAENPQGSPPAQMQTWKETKALYRLLEEPDVTFAALIQAHLQQTREQANTSPVTLLVQDTTALDLSHRHKISGVGQIGNERGRGFFVQTVLAVHPSRREVLGCIAQEPFVRVPAPEGEQRYQRRKRETRETDVWMRQVEAIGTPDPGCTWVHAGDREAAPAHLSPSRPGATRRSTGLRTSAEQRKATRQPMTSTGDSVSRKTMRGGLKEKSFPLSPWYRFLFSGTLGAAGAFTMIERSYEWEAKQEVSMRRRI